MTDLLRERQRAYDIASTAWRRERDAGGIVEEEDPVERSKGVTKRCMTPNAKVVMGVWQIAKAELDAAHAEHRRSLGDAECPTCPKGEPRKFVAPDRRLPPEREEDVA